MFQRNYKEQLQIAYRNHMLVPFVGSGLSAPFDMPKWNELLQKLFKEYSTYPLDKIRFERALDNYGIVPGSYPHTTGNNSDNLFTILLQVCQII